jgi:alpha-tubulin suppressor-like RCC1 family protein
VAVRTSKAKGFAKKGQVKEDTPVADDSISENAPRRVKAAALPGGRPGDSIVHAACGRSHTLLVGSSGQVWASGLNTSGQVRSDDYTDDCGC